MSVKSLGFRGSERKFGLSTELAPVAAYVGISKNIKDLKDHLSKTQQRMLRPRTSSWSIPQSQAEWGHGPIIVLVMAGVRQNAESALMNYVVSDQQRAAVSRHPGPGRRIWLEESGNGNYCTNALILLIRPSCAIIFTAKL